MITMYRNGLSARLSLCSVAVLLLAANLSAAAAAGKLVDAVKNSDKVSTRALLAQNADVNAPELDGTTALHWAVRRDDVETTKLLLSKGANAKAANRYGITPISVACENGNAAIIEALLQAGADANTVFGEGETALMTAARTGKLDAVKVLLAHGANVNAKEPRQGQTALMWAAAEGNAAVVAELVERGADAHARSDGFTAFLFAVREGRADVVKVLLKAGGDANEKWTPNSRRTPGSGSAALTLAVANAHYELASMLLDAGADPNAAEQGWTALHELTWVHKPGTGTNQPAPQGSGNMSSLEFLKKMKAHGANFNAKMTKAARFGPTDIHMQGATPFLMAARTADAPLMRALAELGADPLLPNSDGSTPILVAAGLGTHSPGEDAGTESEVLEAVKTAIELGGDVNSVDKNGETVMHAVALKQVPSVAKYLYEHGAKMEIWNTKDSAGFTPLRIAEGVFYEDKVRQRVPAVADYFVEVMKKAGVSTETEEQDLTVARKRREKL
jgi:uncharacterized protein